MSTQANADGALVEGEDPPHPSIEERERVIRAGFEARGWRIVSLASDPGKRLTRVRVERGDRAYLLEVFIFPNLAWARRTADEKRIQLSRAYAEHREEFELPNDGARKCLLLGLYQRQGKTVICAWDAAFYRDHANPSSCYVRVGAIADAMRSGMGQSIDGKGRLVACFQPDLLPFYAENMSMLHERLMIEEDRVDASPGGEPAGAPPPPDSGPGDLPPNPIPADRPRNRILYGAPGTGKSHRLEEEAALLFPDGQLRERTTFHPDYTYAQFVGAYRPTPVYRDAGGELMEADGAPAKPLEPLIDYRFVPGPFLRMLVKALKDPAHSFLLLIEELNRANAPAVFGEVFQLLDRAADGSGKFPVDLPAEAKAYLAANGIVGGVRLPANLYLWATMNSADQGVMPLDAAFKRRWSFEYVPLNAGEDVTAPWAIHLNFLGGAVPWNAFRSVINGQLRKHGVPEDRLLGPFFMQPHELASEQAFVNKLLLYLRDDVVRHDPDLLFRDGNASFGALAEAYARDEAIFNDDLAFPSPA